MTCRVLADAGYRWATSTLEASGIVDRERAVSPEAVRGASEYWSPPEEPDSLWLIDGVLPRVRAFFEKHAAHTLRFGDFEELAGTKDTAFLDWLDASVRPELSPRFFVEVLGFTRWVDALDWIRTTEHVPWWWSDSELVDAVRGRVEDLAARAYK
jgi:hypothetical protein